MDLQLLYVHGKGGASSEYVAIEVLRDCDLEDYAVADTTYATPTNISNRLRNMHWFGSRQVRAGDIVYLDTGVGKDRTYIDRTGSTVHQIYWGLKRAVWNNTGDAAVLIHTPAWQVVAVP